VSVRITIALFLAAMLALAILSAHGYPYWRAPPDCVSRP
jgi:hypothetical protein